MAINWRKRFTGSIMLDNQSADNLYNDGALHDWRLASCRDVSGRQFQSARVLRAIRAAEGRLTMNDTAHSQVVAGQSGRVHYKTYRKETPYLFA